LRKLRAGHYFDILESGSARREFVLHVGEEGHGGSLVARCANAFERGEACPGISRLAAIEIHDQQRGRITG